MSGRQGGYQYRTRDRSVILYPKFVGLRSGQCIDTEEKSSGYRGDTSPREERFTDREGVGVKSDNLEEVKIFSIVFVKDRESE